MGPWVAGRTTWRGEISGLRGSCTDVDLSSRQGRDMNFRENSLDEESPLDRKGERGGRDRPRGAVTYMVVGTSVE